MVPFAVQQVVVPDFNVAYERKIEVYQVLTWYVPARFRMSRESDSYLYPLYAFLCSMYVPGSRSEDVQGTYQA